MDITQKELDAILTKEAKKDVRRARRDGELLIGGTKLGTLRLFRVTDDTLQLNTQGVDFKTLVIGSPAEVVRVLAPLYVVSGI